MTESQIDWVSRNRTAATRPAERGMRRAVGHAEDVSSGWQEMATAQLQTFVAQRRGAPFLTEDFVRWVRFRMKAPPDDRAYGTVMRSAGRTGLIRKVGFGPAETSNGSLKVRWAGVQ